MIAEEVWTTEEDFALKHLREERQITKWSVVAKKMSEEFNFPERTGKQYKERYHNQIAGLPYLQPWSREEELELYCLHDEIGNKWSILSQKMVGRKDTMIKNHFYSKLRKALRKLNKYIQQKLKKQCRQLSLAMLSKLVDGAQERFRVQAVDERSENELVVAKTCNRLKNELLAYSDDEEDTIQQQKIKEMIYQIQKVTKKYKKKPKVDRRKKSCREIPYSKLKEKSITSLGQISDDTFSDYSSYDSFNEIKFYDPKDYELSYELKDQINRLDSIIEESSCLSSQIYRKSDNSKPSYAQSFKEERNSVSLGRMSGVLNRLDVNMLPISQKSSSFCLKESRFSDTIENEDIQENIVKLDGSGKQLHLNGSQEAINSFLEIGQVEADQMDLLFND